MEITDKTQIRINSSKLELFNQIKKFLANIFGLMLSIFVEINQK